MQFTELNFLFIFLPILLVIYYFTKEEFREIILLAMSFVFYACGSPAYITYFFMSLIVNSFLSLVIINLIENDKHLIAKILLIIGIIFDIGPLVFYKYINFIIESSNHFFNTDWNLKSIIIPLGISFYTFKAIALLVDSYKGKVGNSSIITVISYLSLFAQIQSGPISRYSEYKKRDYSLNKVTAGTVRFMIGFSKKVLLADVLSNITTEIFDNTIYYSTALVWLGSICYSLQLYYDFSGYSDMAIGICNILGIDCCENFNYPYATSSVSEFWRRWHISLSSWFRDYIYIPMGGSRVGKFRLYINLFAVWFLTGLWHGAGWNFIVWGIGYFALISFEKATNIPQRFTNKIHKAIYRVFAIVFINFQWVLFRSQTLVNGLKFIKRMCIITNNNISTQRALFLFNDYKFFIIIAIIFATPISNFVKKKTFVKEISQYIYNVLSAIFILATFTIALSFVISGQNSPFLYGNF